MRPEAAQQTTGMPGSPNATTTIGGRYLPNPPPPFRGEINPNALQSKPYWPARVVPPQGAPNVLLIMTDDTGFGASSTFGGVTPMPTLDRLARMGLRYTNMNSTALCSPSRAALITGRNLHTAGFGVVSGQATGFPGYDSFIGKDVATIGEILKQNGYATSWFGKAHNTRFSRQAKPGRSINGRSVWVLNISTGSSAAIPACGSRTCSGKRRRLRLTSAIPVGS